jgi:hypothetical protein
MTPSTRSTSTPVLPADPSDPALPGFLQLPEHSAAEAAEAALSADPEITDDDRVALAKELARVALERASQERAARVARDAAMLQAEATPSSPAAEIEAPAPAPAPAPTPAPAPAPAVATGAPKRRSLAERAPPPMSAAKSALDAARRAATKVEAPAAPSITLPAEAPKKRHARPEAPVDTEVVAGPAPKAAAATPTAPAPAAAVPGRVVAGEATGSPDPARALAVLGEVELVRKQAIEDRTVFGAVWAAHRAHALNAGDLSMAAMATVLIDASSRVPAGHLHALEVVTHGTAWAAWVDSSRDCLLGVALVPNLWLAGT